jgi:hypothetical protein
VNSNDPKKSPMRVMAENPVATARYLAETQRTLLEIGANLESLARETRVHLRDTHVEGDRWYHRKLRARPVERALQQVLNNLHDLTLGLEKTAYKRRAHDEAVVNTLERRKEKALEKQRRGTQELQAAPAEVTDNMNSGYGGPTSIYDLRHRDSA